MTTYKITGSDAIRLAERDNLTIHCYSNPIDDGGVVTAGVARQIAKEDPNLVYVDVVADGWWDNRRLTSIDGYNVADYFNSTGMYLGPDGFDIEPTFSDAPAQ
jgi:hypothetical protein